MQLKKTLLNITQESKQNISEFDNNNFPNSFNIQNTANKINTSIRESSNEKEILINDDQSSTKEKHNETYEKQLDMGCSPTNSPHKDLFNMSCNNNSKPKIDNYFNHNLIDTNSNIQDIENNFNTNDENFFNYSFYNNKNNNKNKIININNNYKNKLSENNEIKNIQNEVEPKNIPNNYQINDIHNSKSNIEQSFTNYSRIQSIEPFNSNINNRTSFFSIENSNSNFKKKTKHKKQFKVRFGDWICPKCENLNFSFRKKCNRCGLSKDKIEHNNHSNNNSIQNHENNINEQRPIMFNNININYIFNSNYPLNNINIVYNPILFNTNNINNYYGNYNNYQIYYPCNVNIK